MLETSMPNYDFYHQLSKEIILCLRGDRSQIELSQQLGYSFNQVGKWESGVTLFHWDDFVRLNEVMQIPWKKHFNDVFSFSANQSLDNQSVFEILRQFFGYATMADMAQKMHKSKSTISRLKNDQVKADFTDILRVMDQRSFVLVSWLTRFLDIQKLPLLKPRYEKEMNIFKSLLQVPWAASLNAAVQLAKPPGEDHIAWLAKKTGLTIEQTQQAMQILIESNVVQRQGDQFISVVRDFTILRNPEFRRFTHYMAQHIARSFDSQRPRTPNLQNPSLTSTRVYPMSSEASRKISEALVLFHHQVAEIIKSDQGEPDHVRALVIHCLDLELLGQPPSH